MNHAPTYRELESIVVKITNSQEYMFEVSKKLEEITEKMTPEEVKKACDEMRTTIHDAHNWASKARSAVKDLGENDPIVSVDEDEYP